MAWWDIWEQPFSRANEEDSDDNNTNINMQQENKGEEAKGIWVLCFLLFFCLGFVLWWVLFLGFHQALKVFITKNLVITYKLNTIEIFYYKERDFTIILVLLVLVTILEK